VRIIGAYVVHGFFFMLLSKLLFKVVKPKHDKKHVKKMGEFMYEK